MEKPKVALVLSTGGARGISFIGVIEELLRQGFEISSIAGCSIGALIGAAYATNSFDTCKEVLCSFNKRKMMSLIDLSFANKGIMKGERIMKVLKTYIPDVNIEDLPIPFTAVATDIIREKEVVLDSGSIHNAIRASISMPGVFCPAHYKDMLLVDGGLTNPLPLDRVKRMHRDIVLGAIAGGPDIDSVNNKLSASAILTKASTMMIQKIIGASIEKFQPEIVINIPGSRYSVMQFNKAAEIIELGRETARLEIEKYKLSLRNE